MHPSCVYLTAPAAERCINLYYTVKLKSSLWLVTIFFPLLVAEKVGKFSDTLKNDFFFLKRHIQIATGFKTSKEGKNNSKKQILLRILCKIAPGGSRSVSLQENLASALHESSLILSEQRCKVPSVDLSPMSDPVCSVKPFHVLPQCAAEVPYMVKNIN